MSEDRGTAWTVEGGEAGVRLDKFLAAPERAGSRRRAADAVARGRVLVNGDVVGTDEGARALAAGDRVQLWMDRPGSRHRPLRTLGDPSLPIVYEDADVLVVNKPAGLLTVPLGTAPGDPSVFDRIADRLRSHRRARPLVVHRIDRDTSGLVCFARNADAQAALKAQFLAREPERVYLAVVYGWPEPSSGAWTDYLAWDAERLLQCPVSARHPRAKQAISRYRVLEARPGTSLVEVRLETGKRNQIRVQASLRGHTLVGERRYVADADPAALVPFGRQALHAWRLGFRHPFDGRVLVFEAPLPADLAGLLRRLGYRTFRRSERPAGRQRT